MAADELVEEVDPQGRVLRVVTRGEMRAGRIRHRCVFIVVRDLDDRILVHRRSPWKDMWPSRWDLAVGGVVAAGEPWADAARRELGEEAGILEAPIPIDGTWRYEDADVAEVCRVFTVTYRPEVHGPIRAVDGEVVAWRWMSLSDLCAAVADDPGEWVHDSPAVVLPCLGVGLPGSRSGRGPS